MSVQAIAKSVKISPRKVSQVASLVRGRTVSDALTILSFTNRRSAKPVADVIKSTSANATHNHGYKQEGLFIKEIAVNNGPSLKRFRPVARGMAHPFKHQTSHITVKVEGVLRESVKKAKVEKKPTATKETK